MYTQFILFIVFFIIAKYIYSNYKLSEELFESNEHYQLVSDYFIGEKMNRRKPILWIHTSTEVNARNWQSFCSRNSTKLNQPYLQITMKSIYDACKDSFNICLVDDDVFRRLLSWNIDLDDLADPVKSHYRNLGMSMILHQYGGMFVPQSFLCMKNLIKMYHDGLSTNTMFVVENINRTTDESIYVPDIHFMGCKKKSSMMQQWIDYQEKMYLDKTAQSDIIGTDWLLQKNITIVDGKYIGVKKINGDPLTIDELLGTEPIDIDLYNGILLPQEEILSRFKYAWFARMSPEQILQSTLMINKYIIKSIQVNGS